ncbi:MAG: glycosyltransferase family 39 protein [Acidimicrobiales bacterium]|nr:glycosyltransferase family 39 protein [Acidimicrobiales bacterium]
MTVQAPPGTVVSRPAGPSRPPTRGLEPVTRAVWVVAGLFVALELAVSARYGLHRDELYFLACARHLAWGYVDQPPLVPALAWVQVHAFGTSAPALRVVPALAGGAAVVFSGLMARELGGARRAQTLAALAAATSPQVLGACHLLSTAAIDQFFWAAITLVVLRILRTEDHRLWPLVGLLFGLGLLNKWNIAFLAVGLVVGLLATGRARMFGSSGPWLAGAVALLLWVPNLVWNAGHDWAEVSMLHSLHQENGSLGNVLSFIPAQLVVVGPVLIVLWIAGLRWLLRSTTARPVGVTYLFLLAVFTVTGAKPYYLAGMYFVLFAAGGVWAERRLLDKVPPKGLRGWTALLVAGAVVALPLTLPVIPESWLPTGSWESSINKDLSATVGWQQFVDQVAQISHGLSPSERRHLVVFTGDYGAAGAIDLWGPSVGLPHAISGHNSYWWWGPAGARNGATAIAVDLPRSYLQTIYAQVLPAGAVATPGNVWSEERDDPIWICRGQRTTWAAAWPSAKHYG